MILLAWDSSTADSHLALFEAQDSQSLTCLGTLVLPSAAKHSENLLWGLDQLLQEKSLSLADVDVFAAGIGPGSFTGLRIGLTVARTLAQTLNKPLLPFSSLHWLLEGSFNRQVLDDPSILRLIMRDAFQDQVFYCSPLGEGIVDVEALSSILNEIWKPHYSRWIASGDALSRYPELLAVLPSEKRAEGLLDKISSEAMGKAIEQGLRRVDWRALDPLQVLPNYMRASSAESKASAMQKNKFS